MKLLRSIGREMTLLTRSYYFYIELVMAVVYLVLLLVIMPEHVDVRTVEYYFFDMPQAVYEKLETQLFTGTQISREDVTIKCRGVKMPAVRYRTDRKDVYKVEDGQVLEALCEDSGNVGLKISLENGELHYRYYLQGYETQRYRNLAQLVSSADVVQMTGIAQTKQVRILSAVVHPLTDRQQLLGVLLAVNGAMMGILIMAAYMFEDKKSRMLEALRVTAAPVSSYVASKLCVVLLTALLTSLVVTVPVMGSSVNYVLLTAVMLSAGFCMASAGGLLASFFSELERAFALVFTLLVILLIPAAGMMLPGWNARWIKWIPSYWLLEATLDVLRGTNGTQVWLVCGGFLLAGTVLYLLSLNRYQSRERSGL